MTSDLYQVTSNVYAAVLASAEASPIAPDLGDEKTASEKKAEEEVRRKPSDAKKDDTKAAGKDSDEKSAADKGAGKPAAPPKPVKVDFDGIRNRIVALPLPASDLRGTGTGIEGELVLPGAAAGGRLCRARCDAEPLDAGRAQDGKAGRGCGGI